MGTVPFFPPHRVLAVVRHPVGGIRTHLLYTYPILAKEGYSFTFVLPEIEASRCFQREVQSWPDVEVVEAPMVGRYRQHCRFVPTIRRLLRERRFHLIHSQGIIAASQVVLANFGFGLPHIATSQDMIRREEFSGLLGRVKLVVLSGVLSRVNTLVTVTHDARQNHLDLLPVLRILKRPVVPIVNGIDVDLFRPDRIPADDQFRQRLGLDENVFLAGFLGRFMEQKGFLVLVDALDKLVNEGLPRPFHLVAVGSSDFVREYRTEVEKRPHVASRVSFLPHVPGTAPILRQLDLVVMPSLWEACGILAMEAMAMGIPVIGSNCPGLGEVLRGTPSRSVPPNNPAALAQALREAMTSPRKQEAMDYAAQARERFDVRHNARALLQLFSDVAR